MRTLWCVLLFAGMAFPRTEFWAPAAPPLTHYSAEVRYDAETSRLTGTETIRFRNDTRRSIGRLLMQWFGDPIAVTVAGVRLNASVADSGTLLDLPEDLAPGAEITLTVTFGAAWKLDPKTNSAISSYITPRLWWGSGTLSEYEVRLLAPPGYVWGASGRFDRAKGVYVAERARAFGAFLGKAYESAETESAGVQVRAIFTPKGRPCAELALKTAADAIAFYRDRFGVYPHRSLTVVPGMDSPSGGYPPATALVTIHGQERFAERPEAFWRWITAHEVGHMYWGDYVLAQGPDSLSWLMLGMGIRADQEYRRARGIKDAGNLEANWGSGLIQGRDTVMDVTREQRRSIRWDFNNIVEHGKSIAMLNALESVVGRETFADLYRRCLRDYAGKRFGWREFQRAVELESGQDLDWFFEAWVRSGANPFYQAIAQGCTPLAAGFDCTVKVESAGEMRMPVTIAARFEDGTEQRTRADRMLRSELLRFKSKAALRGVVVDPDHEYVLVDAPASMQSLTFKIGDLPWGADPAASMALYAQDWRRLEDTGTRFRLALLLFDGRHYAEALEAIKSVAAEPSRKFVAQAWQGILLDLLGRRAEAVMAYQAALDVPGTPQYRHDQWALTIDKAWVEERVKNAYERK
jgi:hypothetical protein